MTEEALAAFSPAAATMVGDELLREIEAGPRDLGTRRAIKPTRTWKGRLQEVDCTRG